MIINGHALLAKAPITDMLDHSEIIHGTTYGLSELGYDIRCAQDIIFAPTEHNGRFRLASTIEHFNMPVDLSASVCDKSTWARRGVSVFNTLIKPGWVGFLTLELSLCTDDPLVIPAGSAIAQVVFSEVKVPSAYNGIYQNQEPGPQKARTHKGD